MQAKFSALLVAATMMTSSPAAGAEQTPAERDAAKTEEILARAALEKARADLLAARLATLGLTSDATGKTELKEKGGEFEGWLMSAEAIDAASAQIATELDRLAGKDLVLLAGDEAFDLASTDTMQLRMRTLLAFGMAECPTTDVPATDPDGISTAVSGALPVLGALIGAIKTDTEISGFDGPTNAELLVNALASRVTATRNWYLPSDVATVPETSPTLVMWAAVSKRRLALSKCRSALAGKTSAEAKRRLAVVDLGLEAINLFETDQVLGGDGVSPLMKAGRLDSFAQAARDKKLAVVRVYVEKSGGSIILRRNLWTALGARAVGVSGGAVIRWRAADPITGKPLAGDNLTCRTALSDIRHIQAGKVPPRSCGDQTGRDAVLASARAKEKTQ